MPIAHCFVKEKLVSGVSIDQVVQDWAVAIAVNPKDITINLVITEQQAGNPYSVLINLYLPTVWSAEDVQNIQLALHKVVTDHFQVLNNEVFIMTSLIQSGHVVENGRMMEW